jgi:GMP synthase (glutamine-hydrolysing)
VRFWKIMAQKRNTSSRPVLVIDFGAQYAQLIARRVREAHIYSELVPHTMSAKAMLAKNPLAIILSGGPASVYAPNAPTVDVMILKAGVPVFGICYGFQLMAQGLGGKVIKTGLREFGATELEAKSGSRLFYDLPLKQMTWMSHGDAVSEAPNDFTITARSPGAPIAAFEDTVNRRAGVQFHPEVLHSEYGQKIIERFLYDIADIKPTWTTTNIIKEQIAIIQRQVGDDQVICGLSGGVDSAVAAALVHEAIGDQLTCVFVDHGLLREGEAKQVEKDYVAATGVKLKVVDVAAKFLHELEGVSDPEQKRKIIGREFIRTFELAAREISAKKPVKYLLQGTLYPDVVESGGGAGTSNIKSHHNVGGLPEDLQFKLIEPLRSLFKDEVRALGRELGLPEEIIGRHPFPGPGLAIRIIGAVTKDRLRILRIADQIAQDELRAAGLASSVWQFPVVLLAGVRSVGVQGDGRTYGHPVVLRPVSSEDAMTADWSRLPYDLLARISNRITNEVPEVNRVTLDITSKPPGTIEWD